MKKNLLLAAALVIAGGVFAEEYTFYFDGTANGSIVVEKDRTGKITITPQNGSVRRGTAINGNTTTETSSDGKWNKTVINGNTTTKTPSNGSWQKEVRNDNTVTQTNGCSYQYGGYRVVVVRNTITRAFQR